MTSDKGDVVWDPFAVLCTTAIASIELDRISFCAEINNDVYDIAIERIEDT